MKLKTLGEIELKKTDWLIEGIIPKGKLTMLYGTGGVGKTSLLLSFAHELWDKYKIWYWDTEDNSQDMRQLAYGWTLSDNFMIGCPENENGEEYMPDPDKLKGFIKDSIEEYGWNLIFIDPITALGIKKAEDNQEVRRVLQPLQSVAAETGCAIVGLHHTRKGVAELSEAFIGAQAFKNCVKHSLCLFQGSDGQRYLLTGKTNTGSGKLAWRVESEDVYGVDVDGEEFFRIRSGKRVPMDPCIAENVFDARKEKKKETSEPLSGIKYALEVFGKSGFTADQYKRLNPAMFSKCYRDMKKQPFWFERSTVQQSLGTIGRPKVEYTLTEQAIAWLEQNG